MQILKSTHNLFQLAIADGWQFSFEDNTYTIFNENELEGVIQISAYVNKNNNTYNVDHQYKKEILEYPDAIITQLSKYDSIQYMTKNLEEEILQLNWVLGHKQIMLFITLTTDLKYIKSVRKLNQLVCKIFTTLKIIS